MMTLRRREMRWAASFTVSTSLLSSQLRTSSAVSIRVDALREWLPAINSTGQFRVSAPSVFAIGPSNDDFINRITVPAGKWEVATMGGTSLEPFEQNLARDFSGSAWWQWQALWNGLVYIETTNIVAVYKGTNSNALVPIYYPKRCPHRRSNDRHSDIGRIRGCFACASI